MGLDDENTDLAMVIALLHDIGRFDQAKKMKTFREKDIEESKITDKVFDDFMMEKTILSKDRKTGIDIWASYIAFVFGLEFNSSLNLIKEKDYVNQLFNRFAYKKDFERMNILRDKANCYLNDRLQ